jgi:hypothetical protein
MREKIVNAQILSSRGQVCTNNGEDISLRRIAMALYSLNPSRLGITHQEVKTRGSLLSTEIRMGRR